jgi:hypothetical protein
VLLTTFRRYTDGSSADEASGLSDGESEGVEPADNREAPEVASDDDTPSKRRKAPSKDPRMTTNKVCPFSL